MSYSARFKEILREEKMSGKDFSFVFGIRYDYYRKCTQNKGNNDRNWMRAFIMGYELGKSSKKSDPPGSVE